MNYEDNIIVVPTDLSEISKNALEHAARISKHIDNKIELIHVIDSELNISDTEVENKRKQLQLIADDFQQDKKITIKATLIRGSIFKSIAEYAETINANLVIMGTHGMKGLQKLTGSWAYKVVSGSKVPFLIVKDNPSKDDKFENIVLPIDFNVDNIEKIETAIYMGKLFKSKIHIFRAPIHDKDLLKQTNINLNIASKLLEQSNIQYEIHESKRTSRFDIETINFALGIQADLILIMTNAKRSNKLPRSRADEVLLEYFFYRSRASRN